MACLTFGHGPNQIVIQVGPYTAGTWNKVVRPDNSKPFPGMDPGGFLQGFMVRSTDSTGINDGHDFQILFNKATTPTGAGYLVSGGPGTDFVLPITFWNFWINPDNSGDLFDVIGYF